MKVFTLKANENWHSDVYHEEWRKHAGKYYTNNINEASVLWLLPAWQWRKIPAYYLLNRKIVVTVHHVVPENFDIRNFLERDKYTDLYNVPCKKTYDFISSYTNKPIEIIGYWLDKEKWQYIDPTHAREKLGIAQDRFVVGSFQRDTEGHDLQTPKLEKGPDLFVEYVKKLKKEKENLCVLLGGWRRQYVIKRLEEEKIEYIYNKLAPHDQIKNMYASCNLYVVSSRYEGGPQAIIEAAAMRVPIISTDVGVASSILSKNCVYDINKKIYYPTQEDIEKSYNNVLEYDINTHIEKYIELFKKCCEI